MDIVIMLTFNPHSLSKIPGAWFSTRIPVVLPLQGDSLRMVPSVTQALN